DESAKAIATSAATVAPRSHVLGTVPGTCPRDSPSVMSVLGYALRWSATACRRSRSSSTSPARSSSRGSCDRLSSPKTRSNIGVVRYLTAPPAPSPPPPCADHPPRAHPDPGRTGRAAGGRGDLRPRHRAEVRDDRQRLQRRLRQPALHGPLEQPPARLGRVARRAEGPAAGDLLQDDAATALAVALRQQAERRLPPFAVVGRRPHELPHP